MGPAGRGGQSGGSAAGGAEAAFELGGHPGIGRGEAAGGFQGAGDGQGAAQPMRRARRIGFRQVPAGDEKIALPLGIPRIGPGERFGDG